MKSPCVGPFLLVVVIAASAALVSFLPGAAAWGVCYDPHRGESATADSMRQDLDKIKSMGFSSVRIYDPIDSGVNVAELAISAGLNVAITIRPQGDGSYSREHIDAAVGVAKAAAEGSGPRVLHIYVGNENLDDGHVPDGGAVPANMLPQIVELKGLVPQGVLVGTVQRNTELLEPRRASIAGIKELFAACDIVGANIHPVFDPNSPDGTAGMASFKGQFGDIGKPGTASEGISKDKIAVTEVGWPTAGDTKEGLGGKATPANGQAFYSEYTKWANENITPDRSFYFQMFDLPYRKGEAGDGKESIEAHFGIVGEDGNFKFSTFDFKKLDG